MTGLIYRITHYQSGIVRAMKKEKVNSTRVWFSLVALGWATYIYSSPAETVFKALMDHAPVWVWSSLFVLHAASIVYGVETGRKNRVLWLLEGYLGAILWVTVATLFYIYTGGPSPSTVGALVAIWLLLRYWKNNECQNN